MREIGMKTVRVFPSWRDFQPIELFCSGGNLPKEVRMFGKTLPDTEIGRAGIDEVMIRRFRRMTEIAEENGLELIVALITGAMSGLMLAPPALARLNFFTDPFALKWEVRFVRTMVRELKDCSSIVMWELGNECSNLSYGSRDDGWIWTALIASAIRSEDPIRPVSSGLHGLLPANDTEFTEPQDLWTIQGQGENCDYLTAHPYPFSVTK
ncbi:beta-mannanase, partial [bacterium]|nr:beta-mannanase [bacterium]